MFTQVDQAFSDKTAKVVVVEASSAARHTLCELVKTCGFADVQGVGAVKEVLPLLEVDRIDWLLLPLAADEALNAMQVLKLGMTYPQLKSMRVSLLLEEQELAVLPLAFEMGLLSWFAKPYNKDSLRADLDQLLSTYEQSAWNGTLTAAHYLRAYLIKAQQFSVLLAFEEQLASALPGKPELLLHVAEAQLLNAQSEVGVRTLGQLCLIDPGFEAKAKDIAKKYLGSDALPTMKAHPAGNSFNVLGIETCVVVDPDGTIQKGVSEILREIGVPRIEVFNDGESACQWLKTNPEPAVIFHEWRIPKVKGPVFIQRVRQLQYYDVAMIVVSSLVQQQDLALIREMGVANVVPKPIERGRFVSALVTTIQQDRLPSEVKNLERRIRLLLAAGKMAEATALRNEFLATSEVPEGKRFHLDAEFAYAAKQFLLSRDQAIAALKQAGDSVLLLNLLGKAFMQLRDFHNALRCFEKAQNLSPMNIGRLFDIAEVQTELGQAGKAYDSLALAQTLDPSNNLLQEKKAGCAVASGEVDLARNLMNQMDSVDNIVAYLNNRAVALGRTGRLADSIELYRRSLSSLPERFSEARAVIHYNLGLAHAKRQELEEAALQLDFACRHPQSRVLAKAASLRRRVSEALKRGLPFNVKTAANESEGGDEELALTELVGGGLAGRDAPPSKERAGRGRAAEGARGDVLDALQVRRGDVCCYLLFKCPPAVRDQAALNLAAVAPHFSPREAITRDLTYGLDKTNMREKR